MTELGSDTPGGKVVRGKHAQVTNDPEDDGCINAVLLIRAYCSPELVLHECITKLNTNKNFNV